MIETFTIAGPVSQIRAPQMSLAGEAPCRIASPGDLIPPDPKAPEGPRPTFETTPLEKLRDMPPLAAVRKADHSVAARGTPGAVGHAPAGGTPERAEEGGHGEGTAPCGRHVDRFA